MDSGTRTGDKRHVKWGAVLTTPHITPLLDTKQLSRHDRIRCIKYRDKYKTRQIEKIPAELTLYDNGNLATVRRERHKIPRPQVGGGKRGVIRKLTKDSARRLRHTVSKTDKRQRPLFVTLTYPGSWDRDPRQWKSDIDKLRKRMVRKWGKTWGSIWRMEFQDRGAPHFHLLMWGVNYRALREWLPMAWYQCVGSGDADHLKFGTSVTYVRSRAGTLWYASKELAKLTQAQLNEHIVEKSYGYVDTNTGELLRDDNVVISIGRCWGVWNRESIPWAVEVCIHILEETAKRMLRYFRKFAHLKSRDYRSLTIHLDASYWISKLDKLLSEDMLALSSLYSEFT